VQAVFFPAVAVCWLAWLVGQALSYRRSSGERRLQLKWLLSGATVFIAAGIALVWISNATGLWRFVVGLAAIGTLALPVSIGFGILRFRLYDIDRIISRTLAYAILTGTLVGTYAGLVLLATQVFRFRAPVAVAAPRWPRQLCSIRCGGGCSGWWTGGSIEPGTTPTRPWWRSRPG
jgi:hypothetical protein